MKQYLVMQQHVQGRTLLSGNQLKKFTSEQEIITEISPKQLDDDVLRQEFSLQR